MMFYFKDKKVFKGLQNWLVFQTISVMIGSVMIFETVNFCGNRLLKQNIEFNPLLGFAMILPSGIMMGLLSYVFSIMTYHHISKLLKGIDRVANGNLTVQLDIKKGGPFKDVFEKFNQMVCELRSVQILREDFINHFSHEFKTPIASINGFAELLSKEEISDKERENYLKIIAVESERLGRLSNSVMMLSKLESLQFISEKEEYSLDEQIKRCCILFSEKWSAKKIEFSAELEPIIYYGNQDLMQHVFVNLIDNAIKYTPENGKISIELKKENGLIKMSICDTGKGMSQEDQTHVFSKYYQAGKTENGLGLGLSIVYQIISLCGGRIEVESKIDEGSCFSVFLLEK